MLVSGHTRLNMEIRLVKGSDFTGIVAFDHVAQAEKRRRAFIERSIAEGSAFIGLVGNAILGYGVLEYSFYENGFISMLYIDKKYRRKGFGAELMKYMESMCRTRKLFTSTNQSNKPMQVLLDKLGYQRSGVIENLDVGDPEIVYFKLCDNAR